ncbi:hypothetical protein [Winogradskyella forsetii]|uniref:hypothetical protein n=1 Tax=Winogradskyella forsetii TaxID=2686077 RepID=UPI0015BD1384|nr:hypothetical protein [Winogradskyella forsetii]
MKKMKLFFTLFIGLTILSCSSDDGDDNQQTLSELLINSSPWIFSSYDFIEVTEDNGTPNVLTEMEIENEVTSDFNGISMNFNADGSGGYFSGDNLILSWNWNLNGNNIILSEFEDSEIDDVLLMDIQIENDIFSYEQGLTTNGSTSTVPVYEINFNGRFYYN